MDDEPQVNFPFELAEDALGWPSGSGRKLRFSCEFALSGATASQSC